jgi:general secretion pathway protein G
MNLLEILVTITIIGLLMAAVATNVIGAKDRADHDIARMDVVQLRQAVEGWRLRHPRLPETLAELVPAEVRRIRMDPWGTPYAYTHQGDTFEIVSLGPDREPSADDIHEVAEGTP